MVAASYFVVVDALLRQGGGEPSLASREDPYGSLRMPLSICVILRIYNEDAIRVSFFLFIDCATFAPSRSAFFLPGRFAPFYYRSFYLSLSSLISLPFSLSSVYTIQRARKYLRHRYHRFSRPIGERADVS